MYFKQCNEKSKEIEGVITQTHPGHFLDGRTGGGSFDLAASEEATHPVQILKETLEISQNLQ